MRRFPQRFGIAAADCLLYFCPPPRAISEKKAHEFAKKSAIPIVRNDGRIERIMALLSPAPLKPFHHFQTGRFFPLALKLYRRVRSKYTITLLERILIPKRYRRQAHAINVWA